MEKYKFGKEEDVTCRSLKADELTCPTKETTLPLVIESTNNCSFDFLYDFAIRNKVILRQLLAEHGGILFRGFDIKKPDQFKAVMSTFTTDLAEDYKGIAPRKHVTDHVFTTTEVTDYAIILPHSEMAYSYQRPGIIGFCCQVAPSIYGETSLFNCGSVYNSLSQECIDLLEKGIQYVRCHPHHWEKHLFKTGSTWPESFSTEDKKEVEKSLKEAGFDYEWDEKNQLKITTSLPVFITHPLTKQKYVNILFSHSINEFKTLNLFKQRYSILLRYIVKIVAAFAMLKGKGVGLTKIYDHNGSPLPRHIIKELHKAFWDHSVLFAWRKNDVLVLDNITTAHGRMNVIGSRKILACLGEPYFMEKKI